MEFLLWVLRHASDDSMLDHGRLISDELRQFLRETRGHDDAVQLRGTGATYRTTWCEEERAGGLLLGKGGGHDCGAIAVVNVNLIIEHKHTHPTRSTQ